MAISLVQFESYGRLDTTVPVTFPSTPTAGHFLLVYTTVAATGRNVTGVSDNAGNTYHSVSAVNQGQFTVQLWYAYNCAVTATQTITATLNLSGTCIVTIAEFAGVKSSADPLESSTGNSTALLTDPFDFSIGDVTPSLSGSLIAWGLRSGVGVDQYPPDRNALGEYSTYYSDYTIQAVAGLYSCAWSFTATTTAVGSIAVFLPEDVSTSSLSPSVSASVSASLSPSASASGSPSLSPSESASASASSSPSLSESLSPSFSPAPPGALYVDDFVLTWIGLGITSPSISPSPSVSPSVSISVSPSASRSPSASESFSWLPPRMIRRMRQSPHLTDEQVWLFFHRFQLDLEVGLGEAAGHAIEPVVVLQWSDDGGHTWSQEHPITAGRLGAYKHRAIWRRLGKARTRTWRVIVDDPVAWRLLDAYVQVEKGTR